jgi:hypothetical protein
MDVLLLDGLARLGCLDRKHDLVAELRVALLARAEHLEDASDLSAGIICNLY